MRQILQSLNSGEISLIEAPAPKAGRNQVLIETRNTLISAGTERMLLEFGKGNLLQKAMSQPDKVKQTLTKIKTDGLGQTLDAVKSKLGQPIPLGYCNAGVVAAVGPGVDEFKVGDRVVSNGPHAELVTVGKNLVCKIPDGVSDEEACFVPLAAIGLQSVRLAAPTLGETFCVLGLGLVGLLTAQLLKANGCRVIGADFSKDRLALAKSWGMDTIDLSEGQDPVATVMAMTGGHGADGVIIAASTKSNDPITQAAHMSRKRGRIVLVGVVGLEISRADFYEKELSFTVSCSYGPGRHDPAYEEHGHDYPLAFVRWTEQRNFEACLEEIRMKRLDLSPLISKTVDIGEAEEAYGLIEKGKDSNLGVLLSYPQNRAEKFAKRVSISDSVATTTEKQKASVALIGVGGFGGRVTAPGLAAAGATLKTAVSRGGVSAVIEGQKAGFENASTDTDAVMAADDIDTVVIATRHDSHAELTRQAISAGKNVFVEKPLGLTEADIDEIEAALKKHGEAAPRLMVGFNRRFSPFSIKMKELLDKVREPKCLIGIINAGAIPASHWAHDRVQGGGRIIGEGCHFIDLMRYFVGHPITDVSATQISQPTSDGIKNDKVTITLSFEDGSIATVHYFANGPKTLIKERYEAFADNKFIRLENFQKLVTNGWGKGSNMKGSQDKGHATALAAFVDAVKHGKPSPISLEETLEVSRWTIRAADGLT
jgi:predicted dehydrogenase/threonine dehydrogenase-like Zn-dependent dehydrogenase